MRNHISSSNKSNDDIGIHKQKVKKICLHSLFISCPAYQGQIGISCNSDLIPKIITKKMSVDEIL